MNYRALFLCTLGVILSPSGVVANVLIPDLGDMNCDGESNVVDVQLAIVSALGLPINPLLDQNNDGTVDTCEDYASAVSGDCAVGQVIKWNGSVWEKILWERWRLSHF